jgi:CHAD domain-containing protein
VHHVRTSIKKIGAIIQLASPAMGRGRREYVLELLHEGGSRLGPLRDAEVQVQSLDLLLTTEGLPSEEFSSLREGLCDITKQVRTNDQRQIPRIRGVLKKVLKTIPEWPLDALTGKDLRRRIRRTYRRGRTTLDLCHLSNDLVLFHSWRQLVKQLGYQLRITARFWPDSAEKLISSNQAIGEAAGTAHDFFLLLQTLKQGPKTHSSKQVIQMIEKDLPSLRRKALEEGLLFYEAKPKLFIEELGL